MRFQTALSCPIYEQGDAAGSRGGMEEVGLPLPPHRKRRRRVLTKKKPPLLIGRGGLGDLWLEFYGGEGAISGE
jgi:hypothetical protein